MYPETIFKATNRLGESCHFGSESAAANFAGKHGAITPITIHPEPEILTAPLTLVENTTDVKRCVKSSPTAADDINKAKADAVMEFANSIAAAYESGFVGFDGWDIADIFQSARDNVKSRYKIETKSFQEEWGEEIK